MFLAEHSGLWRQHRTQTDKIHSLIILVHENSPYTFVEFKRARACLKKFAPIDETSKHMGEDPDHVTWQEYKKLYEEFFIAHSGLLSTVKSLYGEYARDELRKICTIFACVHRQLTDTFHYLHEGMLDYPWTGDERTRMKYLVWDVLTESGELSAVSHAHAKTSDVRKRGESHAKGRRPVGFDYTGVGLGLIKNAHDRIEELLDKMEDALTQEKVGDLAKPKTFQRFCKACLVPKPGQGARSARNAAAASDVTSDSDASSDSDDVAVPFVQHQLLPDSSGTASQHLLGNTQ